MHFVDVALLISLPLTVGVLVLSMSLCKWAMFRSPYRARH